MHSSLDALSFGAATREPVTVDPDTALRNMQLRSQRMLLDNHLRNIGGKLTDEQVEDLFDIQLKRTYTCAKGDDWEIVFLEIPRWILSDGDKARDLDALRHGFRRKTVRFISPQLDLPSPAARRLFQVWKKNDGIDAKLIPWSDIDYLEDGQVRLSELLDVDTDISDSSDAASTPSVLPTSASRDRVFISYSHANPVWFRRLEIQLAGLRDKLDVWSDEDIPVGTDWFPRIQSALDRAKIAIMLVTPEFVASDFIRTHEVPRILEAAKRGDLTLFWILVSDSHYEQLGLDTKQASHNIAKPLDSLTRSKRNQTLKTITRKVLDAFEASN
ncbi:MAG: toll/interleukin-1 receptor domain-containing protein [Candidatus Thiodiazotropha sp.]